MTKSILFLLSFLVTRLTFNAQICVANYSNTGSADTISFINNSILSNPHYYWDFGDGSGSNAKDPLHIFPDNGKYLVTLYCKDTVSNCSNYYEKWLNIIKADTVVCNLLLSDTIINCGSDMCLVTTNVSTNCNNVTVDCDAGPGLNGAWNDWLGGGWISALFLDRLQAVVNDTIYGYRIFKEYYKTVEYKYSANTNYQNCSANFEVNISYQTNGALVTLSAMNKNATSYQWEIIGFGNPVYVTTPTTSYLYPYISYEKYFPWLIVLRTADTNNSCGDTITKQILIKNPYYISPTGIGELEKSSFSIYPNPVSDFISINSNNSDITQIELKVFNNLGQVVFNKTINDSQEKINLSSLINGMYTAELTYKNCATRLKFIKN